MADFYLFKFGGYKIPLIYIKEDSYTINPNQRQDLDSYTDANGLTHRNALPHSKTQVQFTTREMKASEFAKLMKGIKSEYHNWDERDAYNCGYYDPEVNDIVTGKHFYLDPSLSIKVKFTNNKGTALRTISEIQWTFIEY